MPDWPCEVTTVEQSILVGDHTAPMLDLTQANDVELIALATHGRGMAPFVVGSVADKILRGSRTPLLACRRVT
ncbi:MAG: universal stress protein [Gemmatimonadaceae bacterium]